MCLKQINFPFKHFHLFGLIILASLVFINFGLQKNMSYPRNGCKSKKSVHNGRVKKKFKKKYGKFHERS